MFVYAYNSGGFGNAIFSQLASILFMEFFGFTRKQIDNPNDIHSFASECINVNDEYFIQIMDAYIYHNNNILDSSKHHFLKGYYQHDHYFIKYKDILLKYLKSYPEELIFAAHSSTPFKWKNIIETIPTPIYDIVIHLRLGDFIDLGWTMHPKSIVDFIENKLLVQNKSIAIVLKPPSNDLEKKYIQFIQKYIPSSVLEMNENPMIDYNIMRNAELLVCSCSTLSWTASFFGKENQTVFFPNYQYRWNHEKFRKPHDHTYYYDFERCNTHQLTQFLDE